MPRRCTVCDHPKRAAIDRALIGGESNRAIAGRFDLARASLQRHAANHLEREVAAAQARRVVTQQRRARSLGDYVVEQMEQAVELRDAALANASTDDRAMARWTAASRIAVQTARLMVRIGEAVERQRQR